ncbi:MAG: hypothetical protein JRG71_05580 [Deltaproteobacteria bacterium]|nr:hypothetical protein [Deltaproteobacteria bacterium]
MAKITRKIKEIHAYRGTRKIEDYDDNFMVSITINLVTNICNRSNFIHKELDLYKEQKKKADTDLRIACGLYICSLVTCWETFFRDLYIFLCDNDESISEMLKNDIRESIPLGLTLGEYSSRKFNFQNLNQTKESFDYIFQRKTEKLTDYFDQDLFQGVISERYALLFKWIQEGNLKESIDGVLEKGFNIRHRVTHDANYLMKFDAELFAEIECVFQTVPQFLASNLAAKYSQKRIVFNLKERCMRMTDDPTSDEGSFVFSIEDFQSKYAIVD